MQKIDSRGFSIGFPEVSPWFFPIKKAPGESISQRSFPNWRLEEELLEPGWAVMGRCHFMVL
jgi:hypothetical protein